MNKTEIYLEDCSDEVIDELMKLTKETLMDSAQVIVDETRKNIKGYTGQLADGVVRQNEDEIYFDKTTGYASITLGYLTQSSFKKNVRKKTFYPNPWWIEFGGVQSHEIQTKQSEKGAPSLTYQLTDKYGTGNTYGFSVNHPGVQPKNYLRNAKDRKFGEVKKIISDGLGKIEDFEAKKIIRKKIS